MDAPPPFFIFGAPRSGTSLLSRMLNSHPRIAVPFESHILSRWSGIVDRYGDLELAANRARLVDDVLRSPVLRMFEPAPDRERVLSRFRRPDLGGLFAAVMEDWAHETGKQRWGEKTPWHAFHWQEIRRWFPDAQVLHILRDGRDVALSQVHARHGPATLYAAAEQWVAYLRCIADIAADLAPQRMLTVRYEQLIRTPETVLRRIMDFLGESFDERMLAFHRDQTPYRTDATNAANLARPLLADNAGKWQHALNAGELRIVEAVAGATLERWGYVRALPSAALGPLEGFRVRRLDHPARRLLKRLRDRQGQHERLYELRTRVHLLARPGRRGRPGALP